MKADIYSTDGKKAGSVTLPESVFNVPWNASLMHQVVTAMQSNARTPVAHTKDRSEVRGGGKKPWRQKGTGRARHGSRRSPIWVGGGMTHGPRNEKDYSKQLNKKVRAKALAIALSQKVRDGEVLFVDSLGLSEPKAAAAKQALTVLAGTKGFEGLATKVRNAALVATVAYDRAAMKSFANFGNITVEEARNLNPVEILQHKYLILTNAAEAVKVLEGRVTQTEKKETAAAA